MTKLAIYRNNNAYQEFLAPAIANRKDFETQVFPIGTNPSEIHRWYTENADYVRGMEKVYMDLTCYEACPLAGLKTNYGHLDFDFHDAACRIMTKATVEETIVEIFRHMLAIEVPDNILLVEEKMSDHNPFSLLDPEISKEENDRRDADMFAKCLEEVTGKSVHRVSLTRETRRGREVVFGGGASPIAGGKSWFFHDRHFRDCSTLLLEMFIGGNVSEFRLPIEDLIRDATRFGITFDTELYSRAIREIVATW